MREDAIAKNQAEALLRRFKDTGLVNPAEQTWQPKPTAGDHARALTQNIVGERDAERPVADEAARALWSYERHDDTVPRDPQAEEK